VIDVIADYQRASAGKRDRPELTILSN
jgi:hypothetical protein